ncbi:MAG: hypothetical protein PHE02_05895 [Lachnospiraceae bacterium]|nr:hypothetical protein [Lachnospiraceae bacterium]
MSLATKTLSKQKRFYFTYIWRGLALVGIGGYAGVMILKDGMGTAVQTGGGVNILLRKLMSGLTQRGINAEQLIPLCMAGLFFIIGAIGLFNVVRGVWQIIPTHTMLGKSVLTQRKGFESFRDVIDSINADMDLEPYIFGSVYIGRKWILDKEAMRLADIRGVFWFDEGAEDYVLCCVDEAQNVWASGLRYSDDRDKAAEYLKKVLPDVATGDKNAYIVFLGGEAIADDEQLPTPTAVPLTPSPEMVFCFVGVDGIPTSNFTYETVCATVRSLEVSQTMALRVLAPLDSPVSEIFFTRTDNGLTVDVHYRQDEKSRHTIKAVDEMQAETILENLIRQKRLPNYFLS